MQGTYFDSSSFFFSDIDIKFVKTVTNFLASQKSDFDGFLLAFVSFGGLGLGLRLTYINRREIVKLNLILISMLLIDFVFVFLVWSVAFWAPKLDFLGLCRWLKT